MAEQETQVLDEALVEEGSLNEADTDTQSPQQATPLSEDAEELANQQKQDQKERSRLGRLEIERKYRASTEQLERAVASLQRKVNLLEQQQTDPLADIEQFREQYAAVDTQETIGNLIGKTENILAKVQERVVELNADIRHEIFADARLQWENARKLWGENNISEAMQNFYMADAAFSLALDRLQLQQDNEEERKSTVNEQRRNGNLNVTPGSAGAAGGMTAEQRWTAYGRGEVAWSKEVQEAGRALGAL
jgi:hypothetical protein